MFRYDMQAAAGDAEAFSAHIAGQPPGTEVFYFVDARRHTLSGNGSELHPVRYQDVDLFEKRGR